MYMPKIYTTGVTCLGKKKKVDTQWTHAHSMVAQAKTVY